MGKLFETILHHFEQELKTIRTGRAQPSVVEGLIVECYGSRTPLQHLAAITAPEPQSLLIQPWDPSIVSDIEKALEKSGLGIHPVSDGKVLRLPFPSMTEERRKLLGKHVAEKAEQAKIAIRKLREDEIKKLRAEEKTGIKSEDTVDMESKQLQNHVDQANQRIADLVDNKNRELSDMH